MSEVMVSVASPPEPSPDAPIPSLSGWQQWRQRLIAWFQFTVTGVLIDSFLLFENTIDLRVYGLERLQEVKRSGHNPLMVIWHGQGLLSMTTFRNEHLCLYASHTREDNYPQHLLLLRHWTLRLIERMGYSVLDASQFKSESRGVMKFVELLRGGTGSVIAADGPAGPIYKAKAGPAFLAKKSGVMLVPLGAAISSGFHLDQWDRFEIPFPFCRAAVVIGEPIMVPANAKGDVLEAVRAALETEMNARAAEAQTRVNQSKGDANLLPLTEEATS